MLQHADGDLKKLAFERDRSDVGQCVASNSKLLSLLTDPPGHYGVQLTPDDLEQLITWMDTYAQRSGSFSEAQEHELVELRHRLSFMLVEPDGQ